MIFEFTRGSPARSNVRLCPVSGLNKRTCPSFSRQTLHHYAIAGTWLVITVRLLSRVFAPSPAFLRLFVGEISRAVQYIKSVDRRLVNIWK